MPRKLPPLDFDHLYKSYQAGKTLEDVATSVGIGTTTLCRHFKQRGYITRHSGSPRKHPGIDVLRRLYVDERLSSGEIGAMFDTSGPMVCAWLNDAGIPVRSASEAIGLHNERIGVEGRRRNTEAAHAAVRGTTKSWEDLCKKALGRERTQSNVSPYDRLMAEAVAASGIEHTVAKAIGPYNIDLAIGSVAVEIFGGNWHSSGRAAERWPERIRYILDSGWHVVVIWVQQPSYPITIEATDYAMALADLARRNPSMIRQYRVIRSTGQEVVRGCAQDDEFPVKRPNRGAPDVWCDHQRVTR